MHASLTDKVIRSNFSFRPSLPSLSGLSEVGFASPAVDNTSALCFQSRHSVPGQDGNFWQQCPPLRSGAPRDDFSAFAPVTAYETAIVASRKKECDRDQITDP